MRQPEQCDHRQNFEHAILDRIEKVVRATNLTRTAIRLFVVLAAKANRKTGMCYPGVKSLARELGVSVQAIRKSCRELEAAGHLFIEQNQSKHRTNNFFILPSLLPAKAVAGFEGESSVSGTLYRGVFGETAVSYHSLSDQDLVAFLQDREWAYE